MARIVMADDGIPFDGHSPESGPLGGAESAFVALAEALAKRGHAVTAFTTKGMETDHNGVQWRPLDGGLPDTADLYIANRGDRLLNLVPHAKSAAFWIHNPARYLLKWRYLSKLWRRKPTIVFIGQYHASTCPAWVPSGGRVVIPYGVDDRFRTALPPSVPPHPHAVFTSNPLRDLQWIIELWVTIVHPAVKNAQLHIYSGPSTYGTVGDAKAEEMRRILAHAERMSSCGIVLHQPLPKEKLARELAGYRVLVYRGTPDETFCSAVAEAQAAGVPAVVCNIGSMPERVDDRATGYVVSAEEGRDEQEFSAATIKLLKEDNAWSRMNRLAIAQQRSRGWEQAAIEFEALLPGRKK